MSKWSSLAVCDYSQPQNHLSPSSPKICHNPSAAFSKPVCFSTRQVSSGLLLLSLNGRTNCSFNSSPWAIRWQALDRPAVYDRLMRFQTSPRVLQRTWQRGGPHLFHYPPCSHSRWVSSVAFPPSRPQVEDFHMSGKGRTSADKGRAFYMKEI